MTYNRTPEFAQAQSVRAKASLKDHVCPKCGNTIRANPGSFRTHVNYCGRDWKADFWAKVNKDAPNGCWEWTASRKEKGYGQFLLKKKMHRAHRLAWVLSGRELPGKGLELAHSCHNRVCVNPDHLRPATHLENMREAKANGSHAHGERSFNAKLTDDAVRTIRREFKAENKRKTNAKELAAKYGVNTGAIHGIINGKYWKHVQ